MKKNVMKRILALFLALLLTAGLFPVLAAGTKAAAANTASDPGAYTVAGYSYDLQAGVYRDDCNRRQQYVYSDGYFAGDPYAYNEHLATMSACLAHSAFAYHDSKAADPYAGQSAHVQDLMRQLGCTAVHVNRSYTLKPTSTSIGVCFGRKDTVIGGEEKILIPIAVRGAGYESEWASNVTLGTGSGEAAGFSSAADQVMSELDYFLRTQDLNGAAEDGDLIFWITGYSRAGATSNLTAKRLVDRFSPDGNTVFAYPIEAPQGGVDAAEVPGMNYGCIHNCINEGDLVPMVAPSAMGFKRYGVDHYVPGTITAADSTSVTATVNFARYGNDPGTSITTYRDNEPVKVGSDAYNAQKEKMLIQLPYINAGYRFNDKFSLYELFLLPHKLSDPLGFVQTEKIDAAAELTEFLNALMEKLQEQVMPSREKYSAEPVKIYGFDGKYYETVSFEQALQVFIPYAFAKPEKLEGILKCAMNIKENTSYASFPPFTSSITMLDIYHSYLGRWKETEDNDGWWGSGFSHEMLLDYFWECMTDKDSADHLDMYLTAAEIRELKPAFYALAETLMYFVDYDFNTKAGSIFDCLDSSHSETLVFLGTLMELGGGLTANHSTELNIAWLKSCDSFFALPETGSQTPVMDGDCNLSIRYFNGTDELLYVTHAEPGETVVFASAGDPDALRFRGWSVDPVTADKNAVRQLPEDIDRFDESVSFTMPQGRLYLRAGYYYRANDVSLIVTPPFPDSPDAVSGAYTDRVSGWRILGTGLSGAGTASVYDYSAAVSAPVVEWGQTATLNGTLCRYGTVKLPGSFYSGGEMKLSVNGAEYSDADAAHFGNIIRIPSGTEASFWLPCEKPVLESVNPLVITCLPGELSEGDVCAMLPAEVTGRLNAEGVCVTLPCGIWRCARYTGTRWADRKFSSSTPGTYTFIARLNGVSGLNTAAYSEKNRGCYAVASVFVGADILTDITVPDLETDYATPLETVLSMLPKTARASVSGSAETAAVRLRGRWVSRDYNPRIPGTYTFTCTADVNGLSGVDVSPYEQANPAHTVTARVTVLKAMIDRGETKYCTVPYGTSAEDAAQAIGRTVTVDTLTIDGFFPVGMAEVPGWEPAASEEYRPDVPGEYLFSAIIDTALVPYAEDFGTVMTFCFVTVEKPYLQKPANIETAVGKGTTEAEAAAMLPCTVSAAVADADGHFTATEDIVRLGEWTCPDYDSTGGIFVFTAEITNLDELSEHYLIPGRPVATATVTVGSDIRIVSASLKLDENINLIYAVELSEGAEDPYMIFTWHGAQFKVTDCTKGEDGLYRFVFSGISPQCMGDSLSAAVYAKAGSAVMTDTAEDYSVRKYCVSQLARAQGELRALLSDLLFYGETAQLYTGYRTDSLVTDGLDLTPGEYLPLSGIRASFEGEPGPDADWKGASLVLGSSPAIRFTFRAASAEDLTVRCTVAGRTRVFTAEEFSPAPGGENVWFVDFPDIAATEFDERVTASFERGGRAEGRTLSYRVAVYVCAMQNSETVPYLAQLVRALYRYGRSAQAYAAVSGRRPAGN